MIDLIQFPRPDGILNYSSFCMKVESYLIFQGIDYRIETVSRPSVSPSRKLPCIRHNGQLIPDSSRILAYLDHAFGIQMDYMLTERQKALSRAIQLIAEESLYWCTLAHRWLEPHNREKITEWALRGKPRFIRQTMGNLFAVKIRHSLWQQGLLRLGENGIRERACQDLEALDGILGGSDYLHGKSMSRVDFAVYAVLANLYRVPFEGWLEEEFLRWPRLVSYVRRMETRLQLSSPEGV